MMEDSVEDVWTQETPAASSDWRLECTKGMRVAPLARASSQSYSRLNLIRLNVQSSVEAPYRERFVWNEADEMWRASLYLYVFPNCPPAEQCPRRYLIERAENPMRSRLRSENQSKPQRRDASAWKCPRSGRSDFWAFPERIAKAQELAVDWTSAPDRYRIVAHPQTRPEAGWLRSLRFFAYPAKKYHVLYRDWPHGAPVTTSHRIVSGHFCPVQRPWRCAFAFFALDVQAPGTNKYYLQSTPDTEYYPRLRLGMTPAETGGWDPNKTLTFYAPDMPWSDTARFTVQYKMRGGPDAELEQNQLLISNLLVPQATGGLWTDKLALYLYPAPTIDLEDYDQPDDWDLQPQYIQQQEAYQGNNFAADDYYFDVIPSFPDGQQYEHGENCLDYYQQSTSTKNTNFSQSENWR